MVVVRDRPPSAEGRGGALEARLALVKLEASGNDFLVVHAGDTWLEPQDEVSRGVPVGGLLARHVRALCDRHRGIGADGVIAWRRPRGGRGRSSGAGPIAASGAGPAAGSGAGPAADADLEMVLWNADGSRAEMSGNGIRCLVHAAVLGGAVPPGVVRVATDAGVRTVEYEPATDPGGTAYASVDMGVVALGPEVDCPWPNVRARGAEVGNPHLVLVGDVELSTLDVPAIVAFAESASGGPVNVEVTRPVTGGHRLELRVFERGVGETAACGTGSCAAALVARSLGVLDPTSEHVVVESSGGHLDVRLGTLDSDRVVLAGPVRKIADVVFDPDPGTAARATSRPLT